MTDSATAISIPDVGAPSPGASSSLFRERSLPGPILDPCTAGLLRELRRQAGPTEAPYVRFYRARFGDRFGLPDEASSTS